MGDDLAAHVRATFGARADDALELLACYGATPPRAGDERVRRAIVALADGDLKELSRLVDVALIDYRDVLFWAEYCDEAAKLKMPADLAERLRDRNGGLPPMSGS